MNENLNNFERYMKRREDAGRVFLNGDPEPNSQLITDVSPATFFGPVGGYVQGAERVAARYKSDSEVFESADNISFEILQMEANDSIAFWVGFQHASARMRGRTEVVPVNLRVTEVFRRENEDWKLIHRHADPMACESLDR